MNKIKEFIRLHKGLSVGVLIVCILFVAAISIFAVVSLTKPEEKKPEEGTEEVYDEWGDRIADLEDEPVSEFDTLFQEPDSLKGNPYEIAINKTQNCITIYQRGQDGKYNVPVKAMICSVGFDTPVGTFQTQEKYTWKIVNGNVWAQYATRVVGNVLIHSMPYASHDKGTLLAAYYNQLGRTLSASCVRVSARDAQWLIENCPSGTTVHVYESDAEEAMQRPVAIKVPEDTNWDPTDSDIANPWNSVVLSYEGLEDVKTIERGLQFDYLEGVTINDTCGNDISSQVEIKTEMDVFTPGTYSVTYHVQDATGKIADKTVTFQVQDTQAPKFSGLKESLYFSSVSAVTRDHILNGVKILDNNTVLPLDDVQIQLPTITEGVNVVTLAVSDSYQNVGTMTISVFVDSNSPKISKTDKAVNIIPLSQKVDEKYALSRIRAIDDGKIVKEDQITVEITPVVWGYKFSYKVTDVQGNTATYQDEVSYVEYTIEAEDEKTVTDIEDMEQLLDGIIIKGNDDSVVKNAIIDVVAEPVSEHEYQVTYTYTYESPLGYNKAITKTIVYLESIQSDSDEPLESEHPSDNEMSTEEPIPTESVFGNSSAT